MRDGWIKSPIESGRTYLIRINNADILWWDDPITGHQSTVEVDLVTGIAYTRALGWPLDWDELVCS